MGFALDHIALGLWNLEDAPPFFEGVLGGEPDPEAPGPGYRWTQWTYRGGGRLEVLEPDASPDGFMRRFLERRGPGIHHATFKVPVLRDACDAAEARGYQVVGYRADSPGWKEAFLHPKQALGIVVQLAETGDGDGSAWRRSWSPPQRSFERPAPVRVVGLRTRARSAARARRQWGEVAGGSCREPGGGDTLLFQWESSPMRIAVDVDPGAEEGPVAIELASDRDLDLPAGPVDPLGARFVQVAE